MAGNGNVIQATGSNFQKDVIESSLPVLVDFWAPWCPPCRALKPEVEKLANERASTLKVATVNVDEEPNLAAKYGVQSIPALMVFKDGQVVDAWVGYMPHAKLANRLAPWAGVSAA